MSSVRIRPCGFEHNHAELIVDRSVLELLIDAVEDVDATKTGLANTVLQDLLKAKEILEILDR